MADIVIPHVFTPNTLIASADVNANFDQIASDAFNKTSGDTVAGDTTFEADVTIEGDLSVTGSLSGVAIDAADLAGTVLAPTIVTSSLTRVGTVTTGTWSATLGAISGAALTTLNANQITSGTIPIDRVSGLTTAAFASQGVAQWANDAGYLTSGATGSVPPGTITMYGGSVTAPADWLFCRGQAISRTTYAALLAVLGFTYGSGDGATTFNVPNLQQRFPLGHTTGGGVGGTLGETGGLISHTHTGPAHTHTVDPPSTSTGSDGGHAHTISGSTASGGVHGHNLAKETDEATVDHTHAFTTTNDGAHSHTMDGIGVSNASIDETVAAPLTTEDGEHGHTGYTAVTLQSTTHHHGLTDADTDESAGHTHTAGTLAVASGAAHTHTVDLAEVTSSSSGTASTGTANPPYLTLSFIIKT